jgi:hypothetical protein
MKRSDSAARMFKEFERSYQETMKLKQSSPWLAVLLFVTLGGLAPACVTTPGGDPEGAAINETAETVLVCAADGEDIGGGLCGGHSAGTVHTSRCCSGVAHFHCPGEGEDASIVCFTP